jgi:hypothetical protein
MAYNMYPSYQYPYQQQYPMQQQVQQPQIQSSGFVSARSIEEAYNWPVAPGNSVTFKIENAPYVCTKTKGVSPFDQPIFEKYRLVKEDEVPPAEQSKPVEAPNYDEQFSQIWEEINAIKSRLGGRKRNDKPTDAHADETGLK